MADQPQSPNSNRISSMLQDLAAQRGGQPVASAPAGGPPPMNLPTAPTPAQRPPVAAPVAPAPRPVTLPPPAAPKPPVGAVPPPRPTPPPAPRELPVTVPPKPAVPPPPPAPPKPVPAPQSPPAVPKPTPPPLTSELRTMASDIGQIQVGRPTTGVRPVAPVAPTPPAPSTTASAAPIPPPRPAAPQISVPTEASGSGKGRKILVFGIGGLILVGIIAFVVSMFGGNGQIAQPTPTPTTSATLAPQIRKLASYFGNPAATVTLGTTAPADDFRNALLTAQPSAKQAVGMAVQMSGSPLLPEAFFRTILGSVPASLSAAFGSDLAVLAYGQTEAYDSAGNQLADSTVRTRLALVVEVTDASAANQAMLAWETAGLASVSEAVFDYRLSDRIVDGFGVGTYRGIPVHYWNFPYADRSLDWAIALASNGKSYLVLTGSRESAFFAIDQLMQ